MFFGQQRYICDPAAASDDVERNLVGKDCLAGPSSALHDVHTTFEKSAAEDLVKGGNTG